MQFIIVCRLSCHCIIMMQHLDVCKKESGKIWHRKPSPTHEGLLLNVTHSVATPLALHSRNVRFLHAAFDVSGDRFIAGDHQGNVFLFDIHKNRFSLVQKTGCPCTALAFAMRRRSEFLVGMSDYSLKCFDTETKDLVAWMKGHEAAIHSISLHASGRYVLTSSVDTGQLWDVDTFQRKRKLNVKENVGIIKVFFLPLSNTIMTCFKDDSIFAWESDSLTCKFQLQVPDGKAPNFKDFTTTRDGRLLVGGGRSRYLHVWSLESRKLQRIIELPKKVTCVRQLAFLPDSFDGGSNQVLGVLSQDGIMRFVNINTCKPLFDIGGMENRITNVSVSANGRHIVAVMDNGCINVYCVQALSEDLNQPPAPLLKVLKSNKMSSDTHDDSELTTKKKVGRKGPTGRARSAPSHRSKVTDDHKNQSDLPDGLNMEKLYSILRGYGEYPTKYRMFIWRSLLRLPENHAAYGALVDKGTHPSYERLHETYPIKSQKLLRVLQRVLSSLAHWSPIFGETEYLPLLAFPFVKLFQNNQLVCFEVIATILTNWCQHWFEYFPNPPINILGVVENVLAHHDKTLLTHFVQHGITSQTYAWPVMETLFSEVLTREEWMKLIDNVFSNPPSFLVMVVVAYCVANQGPLLKCTEHEDFKYFFHHRNAVDVGVVIKEAYRMMDSTPDDIHPQTLLVEFEPLTRGQYPVFNKYPKFIVDYQVQERERIRQEEMEYLRQRQLSLDVQKTTQKKIAEEEAWYRQQELLLHAEDKRRRIMATEEEKLGDQRTRLAALQRELKMKELQLMDATRQKFLTYQQQQKEAELTRLDDEIRRKAQLRETETRAAVEDADIKNMELEIQKKIFEQELFREHEETEQKVRSDYDARRKQEEIEDRMFHHLRQAEQEKEQETHKKAYQSLAHTERQQAEATYTNQMEQMHHLRELERERTTMRVAAAHDRNRHLEEKLQHLLKETEVAKTRDTQATCSDMSREQRASQASETRRLQLLEQEVDRARGHVSRLEQPHHAEPGPLNDVENGIRDLNVGARHNRYLNESDSEQSVQFSLDRGRQGFEHNERELMADVRRMRQKLAQENRHKRPPPVGVTD